MQNRHIVQAAIAAAILLSTGAASAGSATSSFNVTATVAANCTITTTPVAFGSYDPVVTNAATALNANGTVSIACTKGAAPNVTLGTGANVSGVTRRMKGAAATPDYLTYELYLPPNPAVPGTACNYTSPTIWNTSGPANILTATAAPSKVARSYNVCGSVPSAQDVAADSYTDTVVATVNF